MMLSPFCTLTLLLPLVAPSSDLEEGETTWIDARELLVEGQGWSDTAAPWDRLPARAEETVPKSVWGLSHDSAGIAVRFVTDAEAIEVRWTLTGGTLSMPHMPATGVSGVDCYVRGEDSRWRYVDNGRPTAVENRARFRLPSGPEYLLYLPLYNGVRSLEVGVPGGKSISRPPADSERSRAKPIVFYGTSITQGACASRPGMAATAIVGRELDVPVINLGFSGSGEMELEMAELIAELDPSVFVLDCLPNMSIRQIEQRVRRFVQRLRRDHPETPIVLAEDSSFLDTSPTEKGMALRERFERLQCLDVCGLVLLPGSGMLGSDGDGTVDRVHPNDLGMERQAAVFADCLRRLLAPPGPAEPGVCTIDRLSDGPTGAHLAFLSAPPWNYHLCRKCGSTDGGCYPKGSVMAVRTVAAEDCDHEWHKISKTSYRRYIEGRFPDIKVWYAD